MKLNCAPSCYTCDQLHVELRCPLDPNATDALYDGDLDRMFENIVTNPIYEQFQPTVLSRPQYAPGDGPENATYQLGIWLVQFENIATPSEAERLIELGAARGYERSADVGDEQDDGTFTDLVNEGRTSTNTVSAHRL